MDIYSHSIMEDLEMINILLYHSFTNKHLIHKLTELPSNCLNIFLLTKRCSLRFLITFMQRSKWESAGHSAKSEFQVHSSTRTSEKNFILMATSLQSGQ